MRILLNGIKTVEISKSIAKVCNFLTSSLSRFVAVSFPRLLASSRVGRVVSRIKGAEK